MPDKLPDDKLYQFAFAGLAKAGAMKVNFKVVVEEGKVVTYRYVQSEFLHQPFHLYFGHSFELLFELGKLF